MRTYVRAHLPPHKRILPFSQKYHIFLPRSSHHAPRPQPQRPPPPPPVASSSGAIPRGATVVAGWAVWLWWAVVARTTQPVVQHHVPRWWWHSQRATQPATTNNKGERAAANFSWQGARKQQPQHSQEPHPVHQPTTHVAVTRLNRGGAAAPPVLSR